MGITPKNGSENVFIANNPAKDLGYLSFGFGLCYALLKKVGVPDLAVIFLTSELIKRITPAFAAGL